MPENTLTEKTLQAFADAKAFLDTHHNFFVVSHAGTDGDDLGTVLAFAHLLRAQGKQVTPAAVGGVPPSLKFLPGQEFVVDAYPTDTSFDAIILSGCNDPSRTRMPEIVVSGLPLLNIDHHPDNKMYGAVNIVDATKSSVAELMYDFLKYLKFPIDGKISKVLLTGIFTDTGSFMHANTTSDALRAAGEMVSAGARTDKIFSETYTKDISVMKAWAVAMENTRLDSENRIIMSVLSEEDMAQLGELSDEAFTGFVNFLQSVPDVRVALFMRQDGEYIKGSLRSEANRDFNVTNLAHLFGGGGHALASGFRVKGKIVKTEKGWGIV